MKNKITSIVISAFMLTLTGIGSALEPQAAAPLVNVDSSRHWKTHHFAMTNWFYKHKWNDAEEHIRILAEAGYQGAMLSLKDDPRRWKMLPAYLKALKKHNLKLTAVHCRFYLEDGTYPQVIKDNLPLLKDSGAILVPSVGSRKKAERRNPAAVQTVVKILREMSDDAARFGLGGVTPYMHLDNWAESIDDCLFLTEKVDRKNVGLMFHLHHWTAIEERDHKLKSPKTAFKVDQKALNAALARAKPYLMMVVVQGQDNNTASHKIIGEGSFDLGPFVRSLTELNYKGPLGTMGYKQSGDIPAKLAKAHKSWVQIRDKVLSSKFKTSTQSNKKSNGKLVVTEFASVGMIGSVVGISLDKQGRVYATHTNRRSRAALDIRKHPSWVEETLASKSVEDKRKLIRSRKKDWEKLSQYKELIVRLSDTDGDGKADERKVMYEGFNSEVHGLAGGILYHDGSAYVTCIPGFYKLTDTNNDGKMDEVKEIANDLGIHIGYGGHDMHGPTLGPDGRIYWSIGDKSFAVMENGKKRIYQGHGGVLRIEPDGSGFEVFAHGLRNPQELAFDEFGNLFTVDNDGDFGDRERVHYILEGSDSGWRAHYQYRSNSRWKELSGYNPWIAEGLWKTPHKDQPAYMTPCFANYSTGPIGLAYNPGTALNSRYRNHFFLAESNKRLTAFQVEPSGAGFKMGEPENILSGPFITGVHFGPDGALYLGDWGNNSWQPHNKGRILKLDDPASKNDPLREETRKLLASKPADKTLANLRSLLGHADQRVRMMAQFELVKRNEPGRDQLTSAALVGKNRMARIHGIWGLGQAARQNQQLAPPLMSLLEDSDPEVRAQVAKVLGDAGLTVAADPISKLLADENARVRHIAGIALGKLGSSAHLDQAVAMIASNEANDVFIRHAGVMSLAAVARQEPNKVSALSEHPSTAVRQAAVVALRRQSNPEVTVFLSDSEESVATEAAQAIHDDDSIPAAFPILAALLDDPNITNSIILRRAISANRLLATDFHAQRLAEFAIRKSAPEEMRVEALQTLADWNSPLILDRVQGIHRGLPGASREAAIAAIDQTIGQLLGSKSAALRKATTQLISKLQYGDATKRMEDLFTDKTQDIVLRASALQTLYSLKSSALPEILKLGLTSPHPSLRASALEIQSEIAPLDESTWQALLRANNSKDIQERRSALAAASRIKSDRSKLFLLKKMQGLKKNQTQTDLQLDLYLAAKNSTFKEVKKAAKELELSLSTKLLGLHQLALHGGDSSVGKQIFHANAAAQCIHCHVVGGDAKEIGVGPDLKGIASKKDDAYLLRSLINPNADIAAGFLFETFTLKNGEEKTGNVSKETDKVLTLRDGTKIMAGDIIKRSPINVSAMPPMGSLLSLSEIRDLIAYLNKLK